MNKIWQIIKTEFKIEFAYPLTWVFFLVLPIIFTIVIGAALGGSGQNSVEIADEEQDDRPLLLIIDEDRSILSEKLISHLESSTKVKAIAVMNEQEISEEQQANANGFLTIPLGFEEALLDSENISLQFSTANESYTSIAIENEIRSAINKTNAALMAARSSMMILEEENAIQTVDDEAFFSQQLELAEQLLAEQSFFNLEIHELENDTSSRTAMMGFNQSSSGQLVTWSLITLLGGSIVFVRDRKDGTYQRLFTTPTPKSIYFIGKVLSRMLMGLLQMVILVFFGMYILKVNWGNDPLLLIGFLTCFSFAGTTFGLMLGAFTKSVKQADSLTTLLSMLMAALGGAWWPLEITPTSYQTIVRAIPSTWAMLGFNDIIVKGQGFSGIILESSVLIGFAILFSTIGIWKLNRLER